MRWPTSIRSALMVAVIALLLSGLLLASLSFATAQSSPVAEPELPPAQAVERAWRLAQQVGAYHIDADLRQTAVANSSITNVGQGDLQDALHLEGDANLPARQLHLTLWSQGGSVLDAASGVEIKVEGERAYGRRQGESWEEIDNFTGSFAPQGDFMAFLVAAKNVQRAAGSDESLNDAFTFDIDGPSYAAYVRDQLTAYLTSQGELPPGVGLDLSQTYVNMTGGGELWLDADGLPRRETLHLRFPPVKDEQEVRVELTVDFSGFTQAAAADNGVAPSASGALTAVLDRTAFAVPLGMALTVVALLMVRRRSRRVYAGMVVFLILSMTFSPLLQSAQAAGFAAREQARAQEQEARRQESEQQQNLAELVANPDWNPNANPLAAQSAATRSAPSAAAPVVRTTSSNTGSSSGDEECDADAVGDADGDGLTDGEECILGLNPSASDTDGDGLADGTEVIGFSYDGKMWYTNPLEIDTNNDGIDDAREWNTGRSDGGVPPDADQDGTPDLFDRDNDGDGVPDNADLSPYYRGDTTYSAGQPFQLLVDDLTAGRPTFVEFQVRPADPEHLWYALNVLDWPRDDQQGQMQDADGETFYDLDTSTSRVPNANGDVKLVPMLEIKVSGAPTNLPTAAECEDDNGEPYTCYPDLEPYSIFVQDLTEDGKDKAIYVPLQLVRDTTGDANVAFSGKMLYDPAETWGNAQQVRLVWVVQALVDVCAAYEDGRCTEYERVNQEQVVQTYGDDWTLTGLSVREEHGTDFAILYEDPAVDGNVNSDDALLYLTYGLDGTFLAGSDCEQWDDKGTDDPSDDTCVSGNGESDITIDEIYRRWNHATNSGVSATETWGIPDKVGNVLSVVTNSYSTIDEAMMHVTMTDTRQILENHFPTSAKPTLLFAREESFRALNMDEQRTSSPNIRWAVDNPRQLILALPTSGNNKVPQRTVAGLNWAPYHYQDDAWSGYPIEDYWDVLEQRFAQNFSGEYADEENPEDTRGGAVFVGQAYYLTLYQGVSVVVEEDGTPQSQDYQTYDKPTWASVSKGAATAIRTIVNIYIMRTFSNSRRALVYLNLIHHSLQEKGKEVIRGTVNTVKSYWQKFRNWFAQKGLLAEGIIIGALIVVLITVVWFVLMLVNHLDKPWAKGTLAGVVGTLLFALSIVLPVKQVISMVKLLVKSGVSALKAVGKVLTMSTEFLGMARRMSWFGMIVGIGLAWGIFFYALGKGWVEPGSVAADAALAQTIAACVVAVLMFVLEITIVGMLIVSIITLIDIILTLLGAGWTITGVITDAVSGVFFSYELAIDEEDPDLVKTGGLDSRLIDPRAGIVPGSQFEFKMTITNTVRQKDPEKWKTQMYLWKYDRDQLRSTAFEYRLGPAATSVETSLWDMSQVWHVSPDHTYRDHQMYQGWVAQSLTAVSTLSQAGVNQSVPLVLSTGYALPGLECWYIPPVGLMWVPLVVCEDKAIEGQAEPVDMGSSIIMDVFPATLDEFMNVSGWASSIVIKDADGDGLLSQNYGGNDPNDAKWDTDGDGLSDAWELRMASKNASDGGLRFDPAKADSDGDGLSDYDEAVLGTDPASADTDGDGITDPAEREGWDFYYGDNKKTRLYSDPNDADWDADGMDDLFERTLHTDCTHAAPANQVKCYRDNRYSPWVWNINPIGIYTEITDEDHVVRPTQSFGYTTTVQNDVKSASGLWVRGTTNLTAGPLTAAPSEMTFDIAKGKAQSLYSTLTVPAGTGDQEVTLATEVNAQLHTPSIYAWENWQASSKAASAAPRGLAVAAVDPNDGWSSAYAALSLEGQSVRAYTATVEGVQASGVDLFGGGTEQSAAQPDVACNDAGTCLAAAAFHDTGDGSYAVHWRTVGPDLAPLGATQTVAGTEIADVAVASDGTDFLVLWSDGPSASRALKALHVLASGSQGGAAVTLDQGSGLRAPDVAWEADRYRAVWQRGNDIYTSWVGRTSGRGATTGVATTGSAETSPQIAYDGLSGRSLVTYLLGGGYAYYARILTGSGMSDRITISNQSDLEYRTGLSSDPINGGWLVAWGVRNTSTIFTRAIGMNGELRGDLQIKSLGNSTLTLALLAAVPRPSVVFSFDEESGAESFADSSGYGRTGLCREADWYGEEFCPDSGETGENARKGKALFFVDSIAGDDLNAVEPQGAVVSNVAYGVTFWFKEDCYWYYGKSKTCGIYSVGEGNPKGYDHHDRDIYLENGNLCARLGKGDPSTTKSEVICSTGVNYSDGAWHHVAHTFGGSVGGQRLYVDGKLVASGVRSSSDLEGDLRALLGYTGGLKQCQENTCYTRTNFTGYMDEFSLYARALSEGEIQNDYLSPLVVYPFEEVSGATTFDNAVRNSAAAGTCSGTSCPQAGVAGQSYNAVHFDGSDDVITGADIPLANNSFTIAFWAKRDEVNQNAYVVSQGDGTAGKDLFFGWWSNNAVICAFDTGNYLVSGSYTADTSWHQWVCTYDAATRVQTLYVDGNKWVDRTATTGYAGTGSLRIGKASWGDHFKGRLDEFAVWPEALPAADVLSLYRKVKALDDSVTEVMLARTTSNTDNLYLNRTAFHETTNTLGKSVQHVEDKIVVDATNPTASITSLADGQHVGNVGTLEIGGQASDNQNVGKVELSVDGGAWQTTEGAEAWSWDWDTNAWAEGRRTLSVRATDAAGNVGGASSITAVLDRTPPVLTVDSIASRARHNSDGRWDVPIRTWYDDASTGRVSWLVQGRVRPAYESAGMGGSGGGWQSVNINTPGNQIASLDYLLSPKDNANRALGEPSGTYTLSLRANDDLGNRLPAATYGQFSIDNAGPIADLRYTGPSTTTITDTAVILTGVITDPGVVASGVDELHVFFVPQEQADIHRGATLRLPLDEHAGDQFFRDYSGYNNNGHCEGPESSWDTWSGACPSMDMHQAPGPKWDRVATFDGDNDVIEIGPATSLYVTRTFTLAAWVYPLVHNPGTYGIAGYRTEEDRYMPSLWFVADDAGDKVRVGFTDTEGQLNTLETSASRWTWSHVAATFDGVSLKLYVNGVERASTDAFAGRRPPGDGLPFDIGRVGDAYLWGMIYDTAIYPRALAADDVSALYGWGRRGYYFAELDHSGPGVVTATWTLTVPENLENFYQVQLQGTDVLGNRKNDSPSLAVWEGLIDTTLPRLEPRLAVVGKPFGPTDVTCFAQDLNLNEATFSGCLCPEANWTRTYYDQVSPWYSRVTTDTTRLYELTAACRLNNAIPLMVHEACDWLGNCGEAQYSDYGELPTPWPTPTALPTRIVTPVPAATPTPTPTITPSPTLAPQLLVDSAVITPTNGTVFSSAGTFSVQGKAYAQSYLSSVKTTSNSTLFHTFTWPKPPLTGAVTETTWSTVYAPLGEGLYHLDSTAMDWSTPSKTQTTTHPITIAVDLLPPSLPVFDQTIITMTQRAALGAAILTGSALDTIGVKRVELNPDSQGWRDASLTGHPTTPSWRYTWPMGDTDPDGVTYNIAARVTDFGGHTSSATAPILFDLQPPAPVVMTMSYQDIYSVRHDVAARQVITDGNLLTLEWTASSDGSGVAGYWVGWTESPTGDANTIFIPAGTTLSITQPVDEASEMYAHVTSVDIYGNERTQVEGPVYVDSPLTPDLLAAQQPSNLAYHGWMDSGCTQLGRSRQVSEHAASGAALFEDQDFYATWDASGLRLAWDGANWEVDGDLFIYLDTMPGGATRLLNPYGGPDAGIYLPGTLTLDDLADEPVFERLHLSDAYEVFSSVAMLADYVVWVQDSENAALLAWNPGTDAWDMVDWLTGEQFQLQNRLTDLYLPFSLLDITSPSTTPLGLLAVTAEQPASAKGILKLWTSFPGGNPLTSELAVNPLAAAAAAQAFALVRYYRWLSMPPLVCPYTSSWLQPAGAPGFRDVDLRAELTADPVGATYAFFGDDLAWQWHNLFSEPGMKSENFTFMDNTNHPLGDGQTVGYALAITNRGTTTATSVTALVKAYNALTLPEGARLDPSYMEYRQLDVGEIAPGETVTATFDGVVDADAATNWRYDRCINVDGLPPETCQALLERVMLDGLVFDASSPISGTGGIPTTPPVEWLWADHTVDIEPPQVVGFSAPNGAVAPGENTVAGYASDPSGITLVEVEITGPGGVSTLNCPDATPDDGEWSCNWSVSGSDGDTFELRARATDGLGFTSDWTAPAWVVVLDATPPTITPDEASWAAVDGQVVGPQGVQLTGWITDTHSSTTVRVCRDEGDEQVCAEAAALLSTQAPTDTAHIYLDTPAEPAAITGSGSAACAGLEITRTIDVADDFMIGDVALGFNAVHAVRDELQVDLIAPSGTLARVIAPTGVISGFANFDVRLTDAAVGALRNPSDDDPNEPYFDRLAQPTEPLSVFNGEASQGAWTLRICDLNPAENEGAYNRSELSLIPHSADVATSGPWSYAVPILPGADGVTQTLTFYGLDLVGNRADEPVSAAHALESGTSLDITYRLDVVAPVITVTQTIEQIFLLQPTSVITGQVSDGDGVAAIYVRVDPPEGASYRDLATLDGGGWSYTLRPTAAGDHTLWVEARDLAGNVTPAGPFEVNIPCSTASLSTGLTGAVTAAGAGSPISLTARVTNTGSSAVDAGVPVSFYDDGVYVGAANTTTMLNPGEAGDLTIAWTVPDVGDHDMTAVVNDNGGWTGPLPLCGPKPEARQTLAVRDVPLGESWNLMSSAVDPLTRDIALVQNPISGTYAVIESYDAGWLTFDPSPTEPDTLSEMDAWHGFWIKVNTGVSPTLRLVGNELAEDAPIDLVAGWNLVSYLPRASLPITQALAAIEGQYLAVHGFDQGARAFYPDLAPSFNTLTAMEPHHGYWIETTGPVTLQYAPTISGPLLAGELSMARGLVVQRPNVETPPAPADLAGELNVTPTDQWINIYSGNALFRGDAVPVGAVVAIFAGGIQCGEFTVGAAGHYGVMPCYRDDPATLDVDEGADPDDTLTFTIDGASAVAQALSLNGTSIDPATPVTWSANLDRWEVDLAVPPLGADLAFFTAHTDGDEVLLTWETVSEVDHQGFNLYRATTPDGPWALLNDSLIASPAPGSTAGQRYEWRDRGVLDDQAHWYQLEAVDANDKLRIVGRASVEAAQPQLSPRLWLPLVICE